MKKVSLLAASVALALVGCGGSDGGSDTNTGTPSAGGIIITGFDGYFKNAVVFLDSNIGTKGQLDQSDTILGLTNTKGQITLPKGTDLSTGTIALQTLKPGDVVKLGLGDRIAAATNKVDFASDYSDTYTTDMDLPGQPMEHSVVFRSQQTGDNVVISPITDLVALQAPVALRTDVTPEQKVCDSLFGENEVTGKECTAKLYSDFTKTDPKLHKTAQILTDTKAKNTNYTAETALKATVIAVAAVETLSSDELKDPTIRTDVTISDSGTVEDTPPVFTESKPLLTEAKYNEVQNAFDSLNIKITKEVAGSKGTLLTSINISDLFTMHNGKTVEIDKSKISVGYALDNKNQSFYGRINDKNEFELYQTAGQSITSVGKVNVIFTTANGENNTTANFSFDVQAEAGAVKPTINTEYLAEAKETLVNLPLIVGQPFNILEEMTLSADALFNETVKTIELSSNANAIGLTIKLDEYQKDIIISGRPTSTAKAGEYFIQLRATTDNGLSSEVVKLELPAIIEGMISINQNEVKLLQDQINSLDLTVGDLINHEALDLDITPLFTSNVTGKIEYYAGLEFDKKQKNNHEYYTTIPGVRVHTDEVNGLGTLTILGTPEEAIKGGYFYVAAGINPDAENEIISKMVKITLPDVKPADEVIPPPAGTHPLENKNWYVLERGSDDGDGIEDNNYSRVWCDTYRFEDGIALSNNRSPSNSNTCSEETAPQDDNGTYVIDENNNLVATFTFIEDGEELTETFTVSINDDTNAPMDEISIGSKSVLFSMEEQGQIEHETKTFFAEKTDAEKRINVKSSDGPELRDAPLYWPGQQDGEYVLRSTSLQMNTAENSSGNSHDYIKVWINGVSCDGLFEGFDGDSPIFEKFIVTSDSISLDDVNGWHGNQLGYSSCFTAEEDGTPNAVISFLFGMNDNYTLNANETYSIMGKVSNGWSSALSDINFNMTWTGSTNND
ncbi:hypothetical protein [Aliivibrio fischeri]|uniref:hypothetical protein n=1 Tax=Aliivibrio fischeri TaxID=668 RepID=UPI00354CAC15